MKKHLVKLLGLLVLALPFGLQAQGSFLDNCTTFNSSLWKIDDWLLGKGSALTGDFAPSGGGVYNFELPANSWNGAEITSKASYGYGQFEAQYKCPNLVANDSAFFLIDSAEDAIDIEVFRDSNNGNKWEVDCSVWIGDNELWDHIYYPSFDPSSGYYDYEIDREPTSIGFYVNGNLECECTTVSDMPTASLEIEMNSWWPTWMNTTQPTSNQFMQANWIGFTAD